MHDTLPRLENYNFPALTRTRLDTLQVNIGYLCNLSCLHCHVAAGPKRTELMDKDTIDTLLLYIDAKGIKQLDLTGGAPEMNPHFKYFVTEARKRGVHVIDRCNLTILEYPGYEDMADFLADNQCEIVASLPCYLEDNVDAQRGKGVFDASIRQLQRLNELGYGKGNSDKQLTLVFNPQGPSLPPPQEALANSYQEHLGEHFGIEFDNLFTITNMPIQRFGSTLISKGTFDGYMDTLMGAHSDDNLDSVMCRNIISVDYEGYVYDCDFNQMLDLPLGAINGNAAKGTAAHQEKVHINDLLSIDLDGKPIVVSGHCYGCTAGQGSSCGGALD